jgi:hypothetical protein
MIGCHFMDLIDQKFKKSGAFNWSHVQYFNL